MSDSTGTGGDLALEVLKFPRINPDDTQAIDDYHLHAINSAVTQKAYTAMQRNFDGDMGRVLDVFNKGQYIGFIEEYDGEYDVYVDIESETGGRALNREALSFEAAARLMHSYVMGEYVEQPQFSANPNVGLGFGLDIEQ